MTIFNSPRLVAKSYTTTKKYHSVCAVCAKTSQCAYTIVHSVVRNWRNVYIPIEILFVQNNL